MIIFKEKSLQIIIKEELVINSMEVQIKISEKDADKTDEFIRTIYTNFPNARWSGKGQGNYIINF